MTFVRHCIASAIALVVMGILFGILLAITGWNFPDSLFVSVPEFLLLSAVNMAIIAIVGVFVYYGTNLVFVDMFNIDRRSLCKFLRSDHPLLGTLFVSLLAGDTTYLTVRAVTWTPLKNNYVIPFFLALFGMLAGATLAHGCGFLRRKEHF